MTYKGPGGGLYLFRQCWCNSTANLRPLFQQLPCIRAAISCIKWTSQFYALIRSELLIEIKLMVRTRPRVSERREGSFNEWAEGGTFIKPSQHLPSANRSSNPSPNQGTGSFLCRFASSRPGRNRTARKASRQQNKLRKPGVFFVTKKRRF